MNPIFQRQWRARWRTNRAFWQLASIIGALAGAILYALAQNQDDLQSGRTLLSALTVGQALVWMLAAPALTATTLAGEREKGQLEAIQLTTLSPIRIIGGFFAGALAFSALLSLSALPFGALGLWLGGTTPGELLTAFALGGATCFGGAALGLCCSAWSRREVAALRVALGISLFQLVFGFLALLIGTWRIISPTPRAILLFLAQFDPVFVALTMPYPWLNGPLQAANTHLFPTIAINPWTLCCLFEIVAGLLLLAASLPPLRRPMLTQLWIEFRWPSRKNKTAPRRHGSLTEVAPTRWTAFANPILARETRAKLRMRKPPTAVIVVEAFMALAVLAAYTPILFAAWFPTAGSAIIAALSGASGFEMPLHEVIWSVGAWMGLSLLLPAALLMGAVGIAHDRESSVWQDLKLSLLSPKELIFGKFGAILWTCGLFSLPGLPLLVAGVRATSYQAFLSNPADARSGVPFDMALAIVVLLFGTTCAAAAWGLLVSWFFPNVNRAVQAALLPALALFGVPLFFTLSRSTPLPWHPGWALWNLLRVYKTEAIWRHLWQAPLLSALVTAFCLAALFFLLKREFRPT